MLTKNHCLLHDLEKIQRPARTMDAQAHARDPNFVKEEFQKALKSQRKGWFSGMFKK